MTTRCSSCEHVNTDDAVFCASCGRFLAWSTPHAPPTAAPRAPHTSGSSAEVRPPTRGPQHGAPQPSAGVRQAATPAPVRRKADTAASAPDSTRSIAEAIEQAHRLARARNRPDLVERLETTRTSLAAPAVTVCVVGEFKRGKSSLVNALVNRSVCPVDADIVTAVPTLVRYGEQPAVIAHRLEEGTTEPVAESVPFDELERIVADAPRGGAGSVTSAEVRIPSRMLRTGLQLLDTPGVGGLESAHGQLTVGSLAAAAGVLFVTDASQELTEPEMAFLRTCLERCSRAAVVVTKIDLYQHWRRIVELNRGHLARADLDVPVIPVSSFLRMQGARFATAVEESGYAKLMQFLASEVMNPALAQAAAIAAHEVDLVADQLARQSDVERAVLARPEGSEHVVEQLNEARGRARELSAPNAGWQQLLNDGIQDLVADIEHDLQSRLRKILADTRDLIDQSDPRDTWTDTGVWLRRQITAAGIANRDRLLQTAGELSEAVAREFNLASGETVAVQIDLATRSLEELHLPVASSFSMPGGRLASLVVTARTTALVPMLAVSVGSLLTGGWLVLLAGGSVIATTGIGAKLFRNESQRHRDYRRQQAKAAAAKFVEEAAFELNKGTRDSLRQTQRALRDEFQSRARMLQASADGALEAARNARVLDPAAQARRSASLEEEVARLGSLRSRLREVSLVGARG